MVKKLFKHEILSYLRLLLPVYLILLGIGAIGRFIQCFEADTITYDLLRGSSLFAFMVAISVSMLLTTIFCVLRFYKNMFTGEGYLTFTLPVTTTQHLLTKLAVAVMAMIATVMAVLLSACVLFAGEWLVEICKAISYMLSTILAEMSALHFWLYIGEMVLLALITVIAELLVYYMCICLGQTFRKNRVLAAIGIYFGLYMITQVLFTFFSIFFSVVAVNWTWLEDLFKLVEKYPYETVHVVLCGASVVMLALGSLYYWICHSVIRKKLNLE